MRWYLLTIFLTGIVIIKQTNLQVIDDPYKGLKEGQIDVYYIDESKDGVRHTVKVYGPERDDTVGTTRVLIDNEGFPELYILERSYIIPID